MEEAAAVLFGIFVLGIFVGLPVIALVLAAKARSEVNRLHEEVKRLEKLQALAGYRIGRAEADLKGGADAGPPAPGAPVPPVEAGAPAPSRAVAAVRRIHEEAAAPGPAAESGVAAPVPPPGAVPAGPPLAVVDSLPPFAPVREQRAAEPSNGAVVPAGTAAVPRPAAFPLPAATGSPESLENFLGGRVFLVVGVLVALLGLGWFLKVAIDRNWIGAGARVGLGLAAGVAALLAGERLRTKGWAIFGQGVMGGGLGAIYITTFFACVRYGFIDRPTTYGAMALLTAGAAALAIRRDAPLLAYLGFLGGFLAPAVLSTGEDRVIELSLWIGILDLGILVVAVKRPWPGLDLLAVLFSAFYFAAWVDDHFQADRPWSGSIALAILAGLALSVALVPPILRREAPPATALFSALVAGAFAVIGGAVILHPEHRRLLGAGIAGLAALYVVAAHLVATRCGARDAAMMLLSLAVGAFAISVPFVFEGRAVAPAWSAAGLGLLVLAVRGAPAPVAVGGTAMLFLAAAESLFGGRWGHDPGMRPALNAAFACAVCPGAALAAGGVLFHRGGRTSPAWTGALLVAGCWLLAGAAAAEAWQSVDPDPAHRQYSPEAPAAAFAGACVLLAAVALLRRGPETLRTLLLLPILLAFACGALAIFEGPGGDFTPVLRPAFLLGFGTAAAAIAAGHLSPSAGGRFLQVAALAFLFVLGSGEIFSWGQWRPLDGLTRQEAEFHAQVAASVAWAVYAAALLVAGFLFRRSEIRWTAIVLFGVTLAKVLLYDTARLDAVYRILSFLMLGGLLVAASFLYQKRKIA